MNRNVMKYIVVTPDDYAVGPFTDLTEAMAYINSDWAKSDLKLLELCPPARGWKKELA